MKFSSHLTEAILLKRVMRFMAEVVLPNRQKLMIRCPNIWNMRGNDTLGTKVWYTKAVGYHCLPTWELSEADGGHLVCVNPELMKPLVIEAIKRSIVTGLDGYNILHAGGQYDQFRSQFILLEKDQQQCYTGIEQVIKIGLNGAGIFPPADGEGLDNLHSLIQAKKDGHRAVLFFCVMHAGIDHIHFNENKYTKYNKLLSEAIDLGVELMAYRTVISLENIELFTQVLVQDTQPARF